MPIGRVIKEKVGVCIEQVYSMKLLLDRLNIESKMFCTRIYEDADYKDKEAFERMHCFLLFFTDDGVFQIEHLDPERVGIHKHESISAAIDFLEKSMKKCTKKIL